MKLVLFLAAALSLTIAVALPANSGCFCQCTKNNGSGYASVNGTIYHFNKTHPLNSSLIPPTPDLNNIFGNGFPFSG
uniref:Putative secreted protein n=1 Tax=Anopheles triannulatus TaxID=58253 RepID=A0A2M4A395_9DIPT